MASRSSGVYWALDSTTVLMVRLPIDGVVGRGREARARRGLPGIVSPIRLGREATRRDGWGPFRVPGDCSRTRTGRRRRLDILDATKDMSGMRPEFRTDLRNCVISAEVLE